MSSDETASHLTRFERIEASRIKRELRQGQREQRRSTKKRKSSFAPQPNRPRRVKGKWQVIKLFDDGRSEVIKDGITFELSDKIAGQMRDRMTDAECRLDYNYVNRIKSK